MKKFVSFLCVFSIILASFATAYANEEQETGQTSFSLSFSEIETLMRENGTSIKALEASSNAEAYEGFNFFTNSWDPIYARDDEGNLTNETIYSGGEPETPQDKERRLEDLAYEIDQSIASAEKTFVDAVNAELNYAILVESLALTQKSFEIATLQYSTGDISKDEYDKALLDLEDALLEQQTLKSNIDLLKSQINISIGRNADSPLTLDPNITYDLSVANSLDYDKDFDKYIDNNPDAKMLEDLVSQMADMHDAVDSFPSETMFNSAKYSYDNMLEMLELGFKAQFTSIENFASDKTLKENALKIATESLEISETMYKNGSLSKVALDGAKLQHLQAETALKTLENTQKATLNSYITMLGQ